MSKITINVSKLHSANKTRGIGIYANALVNSLSKVTSTHQYSLATKKSLLKYADLIHYPFFDLFFLTLPLRQLTKSVVTIHDVTPLVFLKQFKPGIRGKAKLKIQLHALKNVDAIITDSNNSKNDIIKYLKVSSEKIYVVYLGVSDEFKPKTIKSTINKPYILYVGDVNYISISS
jgi:glycosyltransferase involved in cell wall biosynthesis